MSLQIEPSEPEVFNNLRAFLVGGEGAPDYAPDGLINLRKISVEKLARASNVTRTAVYNYINRKNRPTAQVLRSMCEALGVSLTEGLSYCTPVSTTGRPRQKTVKNKDR